MLFGDKILQTGISNRINMKDSTITALVEIAAILFILALLTGFVWIMALFYS